MTNPKKLYFSSIKCKNWCKNFLSCQHFENNNNSKNENKNLNVKLTKRLIVNYA